jgi:hypothetical protein
MKFVPSGRVPFCSQSNNDHFLNEGDNTCWECGRPVTNTTSDHMTHENGDATLCLPCADTYKIMHGLTQIVGA